MTVYMIHPHLSIGNSPMAMRFYERCSAELSVHVPHQAIVNEMVVMQVKSRLEFEDVVIFFNSADQNYSQFLLEFLEEASTIVSKILPIAMTADHRRPPACISSQSFDVFLQLRQRKLTDAQVDTIAVALAREAISLVQPTLARRNMYLFISHRRFDGEAIAGALYDKFVLRAQESFRDLNKVLVGEDAQKIIEENLRQSDAVVFLDTPRSGESQWIARELEIALSRGLPIVWVRIGPDDGRAQQYSFKPAEQPHFYLPELNPASDQLDSLLVDQIIQKAFDISREHAKGVLGHLNRLYSLSKAGTIKLTEVSRQSLTFQIDIPRKGFRYYQRPMTHVVGFYGWIPQEQDRTTFMANIESLDFAPHPRVGQVYDAALMLAPIASENDDSLIEEPHRVDSCDEYLNSLENYIRPASNIKSVKKNSVIISGAFPDCEPHHQQNMTDAVRAFAQAILNRNGKIVFGAHPTFQHLIFDLAKQMRLNDHKDAVHMYVSRHYVAQGNIDESKNSVTVIAVDAVENDRAKSLTKMREMMIADPEAVCMVVIGGKTNRPDIPPGIDEEIALARSQGLPVFLIGAVGGRTAEIAAERDHNGWTDSLNDESPQFNHELMVSLDFNALANEILDKIGL